MDTVGKTIAKTVDKTLTAITPPESHIVVIKSSHYILTAFAVVCAFSWNAAIQDAIDLYLPKDSAKELWAKVFYAVIITVILVMLIVFLPDTKTELPATAQTKLNEIAIEYNKEKIKNLNT